MGMTKLISWAIVQYWRALPLVAALVFWLLASGFRTVLRQREQRLVREALLCASCFGLLFSLACFGCYGLVDPANGLARVPASPAALGRFATFGYASFAVAALAGAWLEVLLRRGREKA
jgi:hypothetical protein